MAKYRYHNNEDCFGIRCSQETKKEIGGILGNGHVAIKKCKYEKYVAKGSKVY